MSHKVPHASSHQFGSTADPLYQTVGTGLTAAGSSQSDALALTANVNEVTTTASGTGVKLPTAVAGLEVTVINQGANILLVYPASGAAIGSKGANNPEWIGPGSRFKFVATSSTQWYIPNLPDIRSLAQGAAGYTTPADANEDVLATINVPPGAIGPNGWVRITTLWTMTNSGNNKTPRIRYSGVSGTIFFAVNYTTVTVAQLQTVIRNRNSASSQVGFVSGSSPFGSTTGTNTTSAVDSTAATTIPITGQKASSGETLILESYIAEICYKP